MWLELAEFYGNLALETLVYAWFCSGMMVEIGEMMQLLDSTASETLTSPTAMQSLYQSRRGGDLNGTCLWQAIDILSCSESNVNGTRNDYLVIPGAFMTANRGWLLALLMVKASKTRCCRGISCTQWAWQCSCCSFPW